MTGRAVAVHDRLMFGYGLFLAPDRVGMAFAAEYDFRSLEQTLFLGCMGIMTAQAPLLAEQRGMYAAQSESLIEHLIVASSAQLVPFPLGLQGVG
jgi:hypothetical protein